MQPAFIKVLTLNYGLNEHIPSNGNLGVIVTPDPELLTLAIQID